MPSNEHAERAAALSVAAPFLELKGIGKLFPGVAALKDVSFAVRPGEVIGLIGENGAGKSTLMKILGGVEAPSEGVLVVDGAERSSFGVSDAIRAGIAFVHQELNLFENLDAAANIFVGREPLRAGPLRLVDEKRMRADAAPLLKRLKVDFGPETSVAAMSIAQRQLLEIAKALSQGARVVIMDEPTSSLSIREANNLLGVIADLRSEGVSVVFISHRLHEVVACADRVLGLRDGRVAGELAGSEITYDRMIRLMIGRDLKSIYVPPSRPPEGRGLEIRGARTTTFPDSAVDLNVRGGEILGLAGLVGAGRTELARAVFGIDALVGGEVALDGAPLRIASPQDAIRHGIYLVPEDRKRTGLLLQTSIQENISLPDLAAYARGGLVSRRREAAVAEAQRSRLAIRAGNVRVRSGTLSGGNQQKVVLAKWLSMRPRAIILDEPTRGVDIGAKKEIYELMRGLCDAGVAVLMISSDMEEVIGVSDRIAVMREGTIGGELERADFSEANVLALAVGQSADRGSGPEERARHA
nr:sugar ABC transporter ATP-binding protein [Aureimonas leprariae]